MPEGIVNAGPITDNDKKVRGLFNLWNDALATEDPKKVAARYSKKGVLLPTVSDVPRTDYPGIVDYFTNFLKLEPQGKVRIYMCNSKFNVSCVGGFSSCMTFIYLHPKDRERQRK